MAKLKKEIEDRLLVSKSMLQLFEADTLFDDKVKKHIATSSKKLKTESEHDLESYVVTFTSDQQIEYCIHIRAIMDSTLAMQGGNLRKVIYNGYEISERGGIYTAEVSFIMIHKFEKTGIRLFSRK